jgi:hypothetical protein
VISRRHKRLLAAKFDDVFDLINQSAAATELSKIDQVATDFREMDCSSCSECEGCLLLMISLKQ